MYCVEGVAKGSDTQLVDIKSKLNHKIKLPDEALFIFCNSFAIFVVGVEATDRWQLREEREREESITTMRYLAVNNFILIRRL